MFLDAFNHRASTSLHTIHALHNAQRRCPTTSTTLQIRVHRSGAELCVSDLAWYVVQPATRLELTIRQRKAVSKTILRGRTSASNLRGRTRRRASSDANFDGRSLTRSKGPEVQRAAAARASNLEDDGEWTIEEVPLTRCASSRSLALSTALLQKTKSVSSSRVALFRFKTGKKSGDSSTTTEYTTPQMSNVDDISYRTTPMMTPAAMRSLAATPGVSPVPSQSASQASLPHSVEELSTVMAVQQPQEVTDHSLEQDSNEQGNPMADAGSARTIKTVRWRREGQSLERRAGHVRTPSIISAASDSSRLSAYSTPPRSKDLRERTWYLPHFMPRWMGHMSRHVRRTCS